MSSEGLDLYTVSVSGLHTAKTQSSGSVRTRQERIAHIVRKYLAIE